MGGPFEGIGRGLLGALELLCLTTVAIGFGNVLSVLLPVRLASRDRRALRQQASGKEGCLAVVKTLLGMGMVVMAGVPVVLCFHHADIVRALRADFDTGVALLLTVPLAVALSVGVLLLGARIAAARIQHRTEWLVGKLTRSED